LDSRLASAAALLLLAVLVGAPCATAAAQAADGPYYINASEVNLRAEPNGEVLLVFEPDEKVFIIKKDGDWAYVSAPVLDKKGWVYRKFLSSERSDGSDDGHNGGKPASAADYTETPVRQHPGAVEVQDVCLKPGDEGESQETQPAKSASSPASPAADIDITTPAELDSSHYKAVGGNDIALIGATDVNVREDASLKSKVVGSVGKGDKVYIVNIQDPWYYVSIPAKGLKGWVFGEYVSELPRVEIKGDDVRLREKPSLKGRIKEELSKGDVFFKFDAKDGWVLVASSASGLKGWVKAEYVKKTEKPASRPYNVQGDDVNFRASPTVDADIITQLPKGTEVQVLGRNDKWSYIQHAGQSGWMYSQYLDPNFKNAPQQVYGKSIGERLIKRAKAMEGTPYVWGGESDGGVDCSGLIYKLLVDEGADAGNLPRRASTQMAELGQAVDKEDLEPGDLVFFHTYKEGASHVGIYLGDGDFIHASSAKHQVAIGNMSDGYYRDRFVGARRITEDELKRLQ
jgi:cell wall-associated NlpC family hydrolase